MRPANHRMIINDATGNRVHGRVLSVRYRGGGVSNVEVETHDVLPLGEYEATYSTYTLSAQGTYTVDSFDSTKDSGWVVRGIFTQRTVQRWA